MRGGRNSLPPFLQQMLPKWQVSALLNRVTDGANSDKTVINCVSGHTRKQGQAACLGKMAEASLPLGLSPTMEKGLPPTVQWAPPLVQRLPFCCPSVFLRIS